MDAASACEPVERDGAASTAGPARVTEQGHAQPRVRDPSRLRRTARRLTHYLRPQAWAIGVGVGTFFGAAAIDPLLPALFKLPLLGIVVRRVQQRVLQVGGQSYESQIRLIGIVDDIARGWRVVRTFGAGAFESRRFADEAAVLRRTTLKATTAGAIMTPL